MSEPFQQLLIHDRTRQQLESFLASPSHGLILTAPSGSGKKRLALDVAAGLLGIESSEKLDSYPYFSLVDPDVPSITIDEIRGLQKLLTLRTPETGKEFRRVIVLVDAGRMRSEAQNAFLKSLEEPPADTCIIFTAEGGSDLLPTIYSRMQRIEVAPVSESQASEYFTKQGISSAQLRSNYALSQGQVGLLQSLLSEEDHELKEWVETAKGLLKSSASERLLIVDQLSKEKSDAKQLIGAFRRIAHAALMSAGKANNAAAIAKWQNGLILSNDADVALLKNANTKLVLDHLLLNL